MSYFMILTQPRNGTHMLRTALDKHPGITCIGEVNALGWGGMPQWVYDCRYRRDVAGFFARVQEEGAKTCFGFCLHLDQLQTTYPLGDFSPDLATGLPALQVVQLVRLNQLAAYVSERIVQITREWVRYAGDKPRSRAARPIVHISPTAAIAWCNRQKALWAEAGWRKAFTRCTVAYEQLVQNPAAELRRVQQFLQVPVRVLQPGTVQLERRPLRQSIRNYDEVAEAFKASPWASCLTGEPENWLDE